MYDPVEKSSKVQVATMVEPELRDALSALAEANERSTAAELRLAIRAYVERANGQAGALAEVAA